MKKVLLCVVLVILMTVSVVFAQDMGVQTISGSADAAEKVNLDDLQIGSEAQIDGFGIITIEDFEFAGSFYVKDEDWIASGEEADYALLHADIINLSFSAKNFLDEAVVKVIYDDSYEFGGWAYQASEKWSSKMPVYLNKENQFAIAPFYRGYYMFGCTLPNYVVGNSSPLKMVINLGGNEITYIIR